MESVTASAHRILELLLTKAVVTGKAKSAILKIPYQDMTQGWPGAKQYGDVDLIIELKTKWAPRDDETLPIEVIEENENGFDPEESA